VKNEPLVKKGWKRVNYSIG